VTLKVGRVAPRAPKMILGTAGVSPAMG